MPKQPSKSLCRRPKLSRELGAPIFATLLTAWTAFIPAAEALPEAADSQANNQAGIILKKKGSLQSIKGPAEWFTGTARIEPIHLDPQPPSRLTSAVVTFEPGARTNWHMHPLGQLLIITSGSGWTQSEDEPRVEINAGDSVWCPPGKKHWHGATNTTGMSHIAIQESLDGKNVEWLEPVTDKQYLD